MKTVKIALFGIRNSKVLFGFMLLICLVILPAFNLINNAGHSFSNSDSIFSINGALVAYFAGLLFPQVLFSYTRSRRENEFYSAMPVKKRQYFWGYFISGMIMFFVPFVLMEGIFSFIYSGAIFNFNPWSVTGPMIIFLSLFCSMTMSVMFSGSLISSIITFILRNVFVLALALPILVLAEVDISSYLTQLAECTVASSPLLGFYPLTVWNYSVAWIWYVQLIIAVGEIILAFFLHKFRRNETAKAIAFPKLRYFYQYLVMLIFVMSINSVWMAVTLAFTADTSFFINGLLNYDSANVRTMLLFDAIGAFLAFIILNIVLERDAKAAFRRIRHFFIFTAVYMLFINLSGLLFSDVQKIYTPIDPDYAVVILYERLDTSSEDFDWEKIENNTENNKYMLYPDSVFERKEYCMVTSLPALDFLKEISIGEIREYNISYTRELGTGSNRFDLLRRPGYGKNCTYYFDIILAEGNCDLENTPDGKAVECVWYDYDKAYIRSGFIDTDESFEDRLADRLSMKALEGYIIDVPGFPNR